MKCACGASWIFCAGVLLQFLEINKAINNIPAENNPGIAVPINWPHLLSPVVIHNASVCKFQFAALIIAWHRFSANSFSWNCRGGYASAGKRAGRKRKLP